MRYKLLIDPGHGGTDSGAGAANGLCESDLVFEFATELREVLVDPNTHGPNVLDVEMTRGRSVEGKLGLSARGAKSDGYDLVLSIHADAAYVLTHDEECATLEADGGVEDPATPCSCNPTYEPDPRVAGTKTFYWPANPIGMRIAENIANAVPDSMRRRWMVFPATKEAWPRVRNVLGVFKPTAVLIETGYMTNPGDVSRLVDPEVRRQLVEAMAFGVWQDMRRKFATL